MVSETELKAELRTSYDSQLLMEKNAEAAISFLLKLCPLDNVAVKIDNAKAEYVSNSKEKIIPMVTTWLDMYAALLESSKQLPLDLMGRAAEIAHNTREKKEEAKTG